MPERECTVFCIHSLYLQNVRKASSLLGNNKSKLETAFNPAKKVFLHPLARECDSQQVCDEKADINAERPH